MGYCDGIMGSGVYYGRAFIRVSPALKDEAYSGPAGGEVVKHRVAGKGLHAD